MDHYAKSGTKFVFSWTDIYERNNNENENENENENDGVLLLMNGQGNLQLIDLVDPNNINIPIEIPDNTKFRFNNGIYNLGINNNNNIAVNGLVFVEANTYYSPMDNIMEPHVFVARTGIILESGSELRVGPGTIYRTEDNTTEMTFNGDSTITLI
jgi:hypothetical protein